MEYSVYYYHSNNDTKTYAFIKQDNLLQIVIGHLQDYLNDYVDATFEKYEFVITMDRLMSYKKLYVYYMLSLLLTENVNKLTYCQDGAWMDFTQNVWCISCKKDWKGMYFTKNFSYSYGFEDYPKSIKITEHNEMVIRYYEEVIDIELTVINIDYLSEYVDEEIQKIEKELLKIEKEVYNQKKLILFSSKLIKFINDDSMIHLNTILLQ
jgi:hypothetical protein